MPLNILRPFHNLVGKGTYWRTYGLALELAARGHARTLLGAGEVGMGKLTIVKQQGVTLITVPSQWQRTQGSGYDLGDIWGRYRWLQVSQTNYDIVHAFESRPATLVPAKLVQRSGALFISDWCDWFGAGGSVEERANPFGRSIMRPIETVFENRSRPGADGITVINKYLYQKALTLGISEERILLLSNGAYNIDFRPQDRSQVRERLGLSQKAPLIAYTGSLFQRDAEFMAASFDLIQELIPDVQLLLVGYTNIAVEDFVRNPQAVLRTGPVTFQELIDYVAACTIGWIPLSNIPANRGRFPMKLNDFMASGRAVVVTDVGNLGEVVRQHELGLVADPSPNSVAQAVSYLLAETAYRENFERQARLAAETTFSWSKIASQLEQFYQRMLAGRSALD